MIPGANILNMALTLIAKQSFQYFQFMSRTPSTAGQYIATYSSPYEMCGSVQAVPRNLYQSYGLDFQNNYLTFFVSAGFLDIERDVSGDQINFRGKRFQCLSKTDWFLIDGWVGIMAVEIPNT